MVTLIMIAMLPAALASLLAFRFVVHFRALSGQKVREIPVIDTERYRPMLRLLSDDYFRLIPSNRSFLAQRRRLFRQYLRELTIDYGKALAGIRLLMVDSDA